MIGGAISGYCAIGSRKNATAPKITKTTEITEAKMGRSMKKCEMRIGDPSVRLRERRGCLCLRRLLLLGCHLGTGSCSHQTVDDNSIVRIEAVLDDPEVIDKLSGG